MIQQIRVSCTSKQTGIAQQPKLTSRLHFTCGTDKEKNNTDAATRQQTLITLHDFCVSSQHSPNTVTSLSHNSIGHGVVGVNMVVLGYSSQHPASKRLSRGETFCPRSWEHHPPTIRSLHRRSPVVCQFLISTILIDVRVLLKLENFFTRKRVTHHSC